MRYLIQNFYKRHQLKKVVALYEVLRSRYTQKQFYTLGQVSTVLNIKNISDDFSLYAYAIYLSKSDFVELYGTANEKDSYDTLRREISTTCFSGSSFLVGTEGVTHDLPKLNRLSQIWHSSSGNQPGI